jgi:two-component system KDP operon response regulator KdpE
MSGRTILVVDDEEDILQFLRMVLGERGYRVLTAAGGEDALTQAQMHRPDLILLDVMMPDMDGWEVLKVLRSDEDTAGLPVAMLSARSEARDRMQGLREGAADYVCKPFSLDELFAKIEAIIGPGEGGGKAGR